MAIPLRVRVAAAKREFSRLLGRVAFGGETVLILRRGRPMAKLVPPNQADEASHLAGVKGWLDDDDPFFDAIDAIVASRGRHRPRVLRRTPRRRSGTR